MAYIRDRYGVPAKRGMRVQGYLPPRGGRGWRLATDSRITSAGGGYLFLDGGGPYHPTYNLVYLDKDGTVLCDTRDGARVGAMNSCHTTSAEGGRKLRVRILRKEFHCLRARYWKLAAGQAVGLRDPVLLHPLRAALQARRRYHRESGAVRGSGPGWMLRWAWG